MKRVVEVALSIGETAYVSPISQFARDKLWDKAEGIYPSPDPKPFEIAVDDERSAIPGLKIPAKDNPEYVSLVTRILKQRVSWHTDQCILASTHFDDEQGLIDKYQEELDVLEDLGIELPESKWESVLLYVLLQNNEDKRAVISAITGRGALTEVEKRESLRIFRSQIQGDSVNGLVREKVAPGVEGE